MIERKFVAQKFKEFHVKQYIKEKLNKVGLSDVKLQRTSMGEKIIVSANKPGLVVGRGGSVIQHLTKVMSEQFKLENPQIEIEEVKNINVNSDIIAEYIVTQLERFGSQRFKGIGHKALSRVMDAGALGIEVLMSGKIPSSRAKRWRFATGYMKKCGDIAITGVNTTITYAKLKTGIIGIQVKIMPGTTILPDKITVSDKEIIIEEIKNDVHLKADKEPNKETKKTNKDKPKKSTTRKTTKKSEPNKETKKTNKDKPKKEVVEKKEEENEI
ncbi:MAG: 30S ribosomal protein S3 [Candidatus Woesearchaeota archaeon]